MASSCVPKIDRAAKKSGVSLRLDHVYALVVSLLFISDMAIADEMPQSGYDADRSGKSILEVDIEKESVEKASAAEESVAKESIEEGGITEQDVEELPPIDNAPTQNETTKPTKEEITAGVKKSSPRRRVGDTYLGVTKGIDNFLSGRKIENSIEESYLKLESIYSEFESGESVGGSQLKFKIDLPKTEDRLKIFFGSDLEEEDSLESDIRSIASGENVGDGGSIAGIELKPKKDSFK